MWVIALALLWVPRLSAPQETPSRAVVIEAVEDGSAAHRAGILPGDVFTSWELASAPGSAPAVSGGLASPFDLDDVEIEQAPRGTLTLRGFRGAQRLAIAAPQERWRLRARPSMTERSLEAYSRGRHLASKGGVEEAVDAWRAAASAAGDDVASAWLLVQAGLALGDAKKMDDAHSVTREALTAAERATNRAAIAGVQEAQARLYERQNDVAKADERYRAVIATRQDTAPPGLGYAKALVDQASMQFDRENLAAAESLLRDAVEIQRRLAPGSVVLGRSLSALGNVLRARDNFKAAEPLLREGADTLERLVPDTADFAVSLNHLANLLWRQGAVEQAAALYGRALGILERTEPSSPATAASLMGIAITAHRRARLAEAETYYRRALALQERLAPGTANEARVLNNLGSLLWDRGDLLAAEEFLVRALAIHERIAPESQNVASTLHNIGLVHDTRGDFTRGEDYFKRSLALKERLAPGGLGSATTLERSWKPRERPRRPRDGRNVPATRAGSP